MNCSRFVARILAGLLIVTPLGGVTPAYADTLLVLPEDSPQALHQAIHRAQKSIDLALYHLDDEGFIEELAAAQQRGVQVRVILNKPNLYPVPFETKINATTIEKLQRYGVQFAYMSDFKYSLFHPKYVVIDARDAWVMTFNWDDFNFKARNFAVQLVASEQVNRLQQIFENDFTGKSSCNDAQVKDYQETGIILGPHAQKEALLAFLEKAQHSIEIYQQDLSDPDVGDLLRAKAAAGVKVRVLMVPFPFGGIDMNRLNQAHLLHAGGKVKFFPRSQLYIHAKVALVDAGIPDQQQLWIGSCNFWPEALKRNRELSIATQDPKVIARLAQVFAVDWQRAGTWEDAQPK